MESEFLFPGIKRILINTGSTSPYKVNNSDNTSHESRTAGMLAARRLLREHQEDYSRSTNSGSKISHGPTAFIF